MEDNIWRYRRPRPGA